MNFLPVILFLCIMKNYLFLLFFITLLIDGLQSQTKVTVELDRNSTLKVNGSTNLLSFTLNQTGNQILNKPILLTASWRGDKLFLSQNKLAINVANFKSNNLIAQSEFYKLMKSDQYPVLKLQLNYIDSINEIQNSKINKGIASMNITITGVTKQYFFPIKTSVYNDFVIVTGRKKMTIKDFGLYPPVAMLGLIKVSEWIEIEFRIKCKLTFPYESVVMNLVGARIE